MLGSLLDSALDRTVLGGYTNLGYALRSHFWSADALPTMAGRTVLITGATSGLGLASAEGFARLGADIILVARDPERGERARARVAEHAEAQAAPPRLELCDLSSLTAVGELADRIDAGADRLDVLVHNAGVLPPARELTEDGIELTFAVNVVAPFLLTRRLVGALGRGRPARIVTVSSGGMYARGLDVDDLQFARGRFSGTVAYARTKRAQVVLTEMWARRLHDRGIVVHAMHPGWADTPGVRASLPAFHRLTRPLLRTPAQGADTIVWLGATPQAGRDTGGFWHDRRRRPTHLVPGTGETEADRRVLWHECERLTGGSVDDGKR